MKEKNHLALLNNYRSQINKMWIAFFLGLLIIIALATKIATTSTAEKTIVVPVGFNKPFTVQGSEYSEPYKEQMATYLLQLLFNYQPNNVKYQFSEFLKYVHPTVSETLRRKLNKDTETILKKKSSSVFYPEKIRTEGNEVFVTGELVGMVGTSVVTNNTIIYKLTFNTENGFYVFGLSEVTLDRDGYSEIIEKDLNLLEEEN